MTVDLSSLYDKYMTEQTLHYPLLASPTDGSMPVYAMVLRSRALSMGRAAARLHLHLPQTLPHPLTPAGTSARRC